MSAQAAYLGSRREAIGGVSQVWTRYEGRQGWSHAGDSRCCRALARIPPPAEMQQGRPSLCCVSTIRSSQGAPEPGEGGCSARPGGCRAGPGGCRAGRGGGRCCMCILGRQSQPLARQKEEWRGWRATGCSWCCCGCSCAGHGKERRPHAQGHPCVPAVGLTCPTVSFPGSAPLVLTHTGSSRVMWPSGLRAGGAGGCRGAAGGADRGLGLQDSCCLP